MRVGGVRVRSFVSLAEFSLNGVEEHLPVLCGLVVSEVVLDVECDLLQEHFANSLNVVPQESADDPRCSRVASQRISETEDPDGLFIV